MKKKGVSMHVVVVLVVHVQRHINKELEYLIARAMIRPSISYIFRDDHPAGVRVVLNR